MRFHYQQSTLEVLKRLVGGKLLRMVLDKNRHYFLRSNDIISISPLLFGDYEPHIQELFRTANEQGYSDFLLDIGANIGLSCCQAEDDFQVIYAFEPNPLAFKILEVNVASTANREKYQLYNLGLGREDSKLKLRIPKHNWGGAFVQSDDNAYSSTTLANKDGFATLDQHNYNTEQVLIKAGRDVLTPIFMQLQEQGLQVGVIKIDVEGFEAVVLEEIAASLPAAFKTIIVFENWDPAFDSTKIAALFQPRRVSMMCLSSASSFAANDSLFVKTLKLLKNLVTGRAGRHYSLTEYGSSQPVVGDFVLTIE